MQKPLKIILGVDPGTLIMGYSIIEVHSNTITVKEIDVLKLVGMKDNYLRLQAIYDKITELITIYRPHEMAIEAPFFGKNVQSMLKLGRAQGVAIAAAMSSGIGVTEYSPKKIKQAISGNGNANKEQIWKMLQAILLLPDRPKYFDATDALAVAVCHHFQDKVPAIKPRMFKKKKSSWQEFIDINQHRVKS